MTKSSVVLELLVQKIQRQLAPQAEVLHNVKLPGRRSGIKRQIDVLVREKIGQYEINIVIDCKDYKRRVDVKGVDEFAGLLEDVGAQKGVLVCPVGFSDAAKTAAAKLQIDLYSPVDTDPHKWQVSPTMPTVCDFRVAAIGFGVSTSAPLPFRLMPNFFSENIIFDGDGIALGNCYAKIVESWNSGKLADALGLTEKLSIFGDYATQTDNGYGTLCPVELLADISVSQQLYFGQMPIAQMSGFKDEMTGHVITNAFSIGLLDPKEIIEKWLPITSENDLVAKPVLRLEGVIGWDENAGVEIKFW